MEHIQLKNHEFIEKQKAKKADKCSEQQRSKTVAPKKAGIDLDKEKPEPENI